MSSDRSDRPDIREKLATRYEQGEIAPLERLPLENAAAERALEVQRELALASDGNHRRPAIDFLIAAAAEAAGPEVALWCFDRDLKVICEFTGQPCEPEASTGPGH